MSDDARAPAPGTSASGAEEVRSYLVRLVALILIGVLSMTAAAVYAWRTYGANLVDTTQRVPTRPAASR